MEEKRGFSLSGRGKMMTRRFPTYGWFLLPCLLLFHLLFAGIMPAKAEINVGIRYDKTNYQEIQELLFPALLNWVKKGEVSLKTDRLDFEWKKSDAFLEASLKNEGKYDISKDGILIEKTTGRPPQFVYGFPFPTIDPKDPRAAEKIMENHSAQLYSLGSHHVPSTSKWLGAKGDVQLEVTSDGDFLFYQQRRQGPIPNPGNVLAVHMVRVFEPFKLKGTNRMTFSYADRREDSGLAYLPSLRRVRRISESDSSNPSLGSNMAPDDTYGWYGKNASMVWRLIGEKTLLMPFSSAKKVIVKEFPDGAIDRVFPDLKLGRETPGWEGAPWYPVDAVWSPVSCWIVEAKPKDAGYFYGKQILYLDKEAYTTPIKEVFNRKEEYWKTLIVIGSYQVTPAGTDLVGAMDFGVMVDDISRHSTYVKVIKMPGIDHRMNLPISVLGPKNYTENSFLQTTK